MYIATIQLHAHKRNSGPVISLRSHGLPNSTVVSYDSEVSATTADTWARCGCVFWGRM